MKTPTTTNLLWCCVLSFVLAVQVLMYLQGIMSIIHFQPPAGQDLLNEWQSQLRPKGDIWFYLVFIISAVAILCGCMKIFSKRLADPAFARILMVYAVVEIIWTGLLLCTWWKLIIYDYRSQLAHIAFYVLLVLGVVIKIFWPELCRIARVFWAFALDARKRLLFRRSVDLLFLAFIVLAIYIPDPQAALAKMFVGEQYHHFDDSVMGPVWIAISGNKVYVDNFSEYGFGLPIIIGHLAQWIGGVSYEHVFVVIMWVCIIYYLLLYLLMRRWYQNILIAIAATLVLIKVQLFYSFSYPMTFTYPSGKVLRSCLDIFFMVSLLAHIHTHRSRYLYFASVITGLAMYYVFTTGIDLFCGLSVYLILHLLSLPFRQYIYKVRTDLLKVLTYFSLPFIICCFLMWLSVGQHLWTGEFWHNVVEFPHLAAMGFLRERYLRGIEVGNFWDVTFGCFIPIVYIFSMIYIGILFYGGKARYKDIFIVVLSVYGLSMYQHYASQSVGNDYYMRAVPFVFIVFHWVNVLLSALPDLRRFKITVVLAAFCAFCLLTNHNFISHPNLLNFSRNPYTDPLVARPLPDGRPYYHHQFAGITDDFKLSANSLGQQDEQLIYSSDYFKNDEELKKYWQKEFDFTPDAALIDELTAPGSKAALISSFDVKMLMQANRRPYFYFFPLMVNRPMYMRIYAHINTNIFVKDQLQMLLDRLAQDKPEYIFMERIYLNRERPKRYFKELDNLLPLLDYVYAHYGPYKNGYFLVAMKRK
jgi:hypothetical protein